MTNTHQFNDILLYTNASGAVKIEVIHENETLWLNQKRLSELFGVSIGVISRHIKNIFEDGELEEQSNLHFLQIANSDKPVGFYSLDVIIAVGYRVNSREATQFRIWATQTLKEFIIKGFVLDDERLKQGKRSGKDYFDGLLERIREIRASERRFYQKITDIYKECSIDYNASSSVTRTFYQTVQNKLEWAITGMTAAEIIAKRVDATAPHMGLQTFKNAPDGKVLPSDVSTAKNYLFEPEMKALERLVSMYLDYAENQAERGIAMRMSDWVLKLDAFLKFNDYDILENAGKVTAEVAKRLALSEFEKFRVQQDAEYNSDFDKVIQKSLAKRKSTKE